jgi:hypothetical protein
MTINYQPTSAFPIELIGDHTVVYGSKMYKWDGEKFHIYRRSEVNGAYELQGTEKEPIIRQWIGRIFMKLYYNTRVKAFRVYVYSEYKTRPDFIEYPTVYPSGGIGWDMPYALPQGILKRMEQVLLNLRAGGII